MRAKPPVEPRVDDLFRNELANIINMRHELVRLSEVIDWAVFDREFGAQFVSRPLHDPASAESIPHAVSIASLGV
jgi:IS5 family transposase